MKSDIIKKQILELINEISDIKYLNSILIYCKRFSKPIINSIPNENLVPKFKINEVVRIIDRKSPFHMKKGVILSHDNQARFSISYVIQLSDSSITKCKETQLKKEGN